MSYCDAFRPCSIVLKCSNAAFVLFSPTLYSGKIARVWSCTAGFDVITYVLVKKIFPLLCLPDFLETFTVVFLFFFCLMRPLSKVETRRNSSFATA